MTVRRAPLAIGPRRVPPRNNHCGNCGEAGHTRLRCNVIDAPIPGCPRCGLRGPHECLGSRSIRWRPE